MKKITHFIAIFAALFATMTTAAQNNKPLEEQAIVHSDMSADQEDCDSSANDTIAVDSTLTAHDPSADGLPWPENLRRRIDKLVAHPMFETSQLGLLVFDLTADSVIYAHGHRQLLRPASTLKLITAIAAIDKLGGSYQFRTSLYYTGQIDSGVLSGDIYCVGGFDPRFNADDMKAFVDGIRSMGVDTIRGRILADRTMKDDDLLGEGWCWDDDNPVLSPLLVSRKDHFLSRFLQELRESGIVVEASTGNAPLPQGAFLVCTRFHTIDQILMRMMKDSDNLYAESLFYQLAASTGERPAKAKHARKEIGRLIEKVGLQPSRYKIADGSGLSLYNYVSPELEVDFLRYAYRHPEIYDNMLPCLPIAGVDGTLSKRMRKGAAHENVKAKTGTVTGVSSLAGYLTTANGHRICFSIINMGIRHSSSGRNFQDKVCQALCK